MRLEVFLRCFCASLPLAIPLCAQDAVKTVKIHPGVTYELITRPQFPAKIHVLSADLSHPEVEAVIRSSERGALKVSELVANEQKRGHIVFGGMNGDYFNNLGATPLGIEVIDGVLLNPPNIRSALILDQQRQPTITVVEMRSTITLENGKSYQPDITNGWSRRGKSVLYTVKTPLNWDPPENSTCAWLVARDPISIGKPFRAEVQKIRADPPWVVLAENQLLLVEPSERPVLLDGTLSSGQIVKVVLAIKGVDGPVQQAIGGGPRLVREGNKSVEHNIEQMGGHQIFDRHPRVGVGYTKDKKSLKLFAVEGRLDESVGMDMSELADIMREHEIWDGMGLDGGGSISLWAGGELRTRAVGSGVHDNERRIANAILVLQRALGGVTRAR